jgi:hypothetical protein
MASSVPSVVPVSPCASAEAICFEPLESRLLLDAVPLTAANGFRHTFQDADGDRVTIALRRCIEGTVDLPPGGDALAIQVTSDDPRASMTVTVRKSPDGDGYTTLGEIGIDGVLGGIRAPKLILDGGKGPGIQSVGTDGGYVRRIELGHVLGGADIVLPGAGRRPVSFTAGCIAGGQTTIVFGSAIRSFSVAEWTDGGSLTAPSAYIIRARGGRVTLGGTRFPASGDLVAEGVFAGKVQRLEVAGDLRGTWEMGSLGRLLCEGWIENSLIGVTGNIGLLKCRGLEGTAVFAGVEQMFDLNSDGVYDLPDPATDLGAGRSVIKSIRVTGDRTRQASVVNSNIAAAVIRHAYLAYPETDNNGEPFGVAAAGVRKITIRDRDGRTTRRKLAWVGDSLVNGDAAVRIADDGTCPRVVGAASTGNTTVIVSFSKPMGATALAPEHYVVVQEAVNPEAGMLHVLGVRFARSDCTEVELTTASQNELTYALTVVGVQDAAGNPLAPRQTVQGVVIDPTRGSFRGTAPVGVEVLDSDGDGLTDHREQLGWTVFVTALDGTVTTRGVSSDPFCIDTDGDGLWDVEEAKLRLDPRNPDTDDDELTDAQEWNEIYSDPTSHDSDGDSLGDSWEYNFWYTSPVQADTDGDQLGDGEEVLLANRNARVADLPAPAIEVGDINLQLDVRFMETTSTETRELEAKSVSSTLAQSDRREYSNMSSSATEDMSKWTVGAEGGYGGGGKAGTGWNFKVSGSHEWGTTNTRTSQNTATSAQETQRAYEDSLSHEAEATVGAEVQREVLGAKIQTTIYIRNAGSLAYRLKNLQVSAFIQDSRDPARLTPVATLVSDQEEPDEGFAFGPLVPQRGPFIFSSDTVFPSLVENLMRNPRSVVFRITNFDIIDELGRNFAFTSEDINNRTGTLLIDFGGCDSDGDGEGDLTEYHRVATDTGQKVARDTNADGQINDRDRVVFDPDGNLVGITLRQALAAIGLTETTTPLADLTPAEIQRTYSTRQLTLDDGTTVTRIVRIRQTPSEEIDTERWVIITPTGIDDRLGLDDVILQAASDVKLVFVRDHDSDGVPASVEFLNGTSDELKDTDDDGLDDRFEALVGWDVDIVGRGTRRVYASGNSVDSDGDGLGDSLEAPGAWNDANGNDLIDEGERVPADADDFVTDPLNPDTDGDGVSDFDEINGYTITLKATGVEITRTTDPTNPDHDGDGGADGLERQLGTDPTVWDNPAQFLDSDRDGLSNFNEEEGWNIVVTGVSTTPVLAESVADEGAETTVPVTSDPYKADTDGDGLSDFEEFGLHTNPRAADTDGDGLSDLDEVDGFELPGPGTITLDPADADTDNDKLSDGQEAGAEGWTVRVVGEDAYLVVSNPLVADADLDTLVDGDEFSHGTDPENPNTDGDKRNDAQDIEDELNPLWEDCLVTVTFTSLAIEYDGDGEGEGGAGDIGYDLTIRKPNDNQDDGLSAWPTHVLTDGFWLTGLRTASDSNTWDVRKNLPDTDEDDADGPAWYEGYFGIQLSGGHTLTFAPYVSESERSCSFSVANGQKFAIECVIGERDDHPATVFCYLGGKEGGKVTPSTGVARHAVFTGQELLQQAGMTGSHTEQLTFSFDSEDETMRFVTGDPGGDIKGELRLSYTVD